MRTSRSAAPLSRFSAVLVGGALIGAERTLHALELDDDDALLKPTLEHLGRGVTRQEAIATRLNRRARQRSILG